ncbi:MAG TPA: hypothetical protein VFV93_03575 [Thermomicrobiales bacterium]|nr:hypothetical protein [Thermomicrobiales bacterium]
MNISARSGWAPEVARRGCTLPPGAAWNGFVLPDVPTAEWPASPLFEQGLDRLVRDALATGRSIHDILTSVAALAQSLAMPMSETDLTRRVKAHVIANT